MADGAAIVVQGGDTNRATAADGDEAAGWPPPALGRDGAFRFLSPDDEIAVAEGELVLRLYRPALATRPAVSEPTRRWSLRMRAAGGD